MSIDAEKNAEKITKLSRKQNASVLFISASAINDLKPTFDRRQEALFSTTFLHDGTKRVKTIDNN